MAAMASWLLWCTTIVLYIPYILLYSPTELDPYDHLESGSVIPKDDYNAARIGAVIILLSFFVDSLLLAGIYIKYKIRTDMLLPWLLYYSFVIIGLAVVAVIGAVQAQGQLQLLALVPAAFAMLYAYLWVCVVYLYKEGCQAKSVILSQLTKITLEPLAQRLLPNRD